MLIDVKFLIKIMIIVIIFSISTMVYFLLAHTGMFRRHPGITAELILIFVGIPNLLLNLFLLIRIIKGLSGASWFHILDVLVLTIVVLISIWFVFNSPN